MFCIYELTFYNLFVSLVGFFLPWKVRNILSHKDSWCFQKDLLRFTYAINYVEIIFKWKDKTEPFFHIQGGRVSDCLRFCFVTSLNLHFAFRCFILKSLYCKNYQVNIHCQPACTFNRGLSGILRAGYEKTRRTLSTFPKATPKSHIDTTDGTLQSWN